MYSNDNFLKRENIILFHNTTYNIIHKTRIIRVRVISRFDNKDKLKLMKYHKAMKLKDKDKQKASIKKGIKDLANIMFYNQ